MSKFEKEFKDLSIVAKEINENNRFPFLHRTHLFMRSMNKNNGIHRNKKKVSLNAGRYKKSFHSLDDILFRKNCTFIREYDEDFVHNQSGLKHRLMIIRRKKKISNGLLQDSALMKTDYDPKLDGPPTEYAIAINLFSIAYWRKAERYLPRKMRADKNKVTIVLKDMWNSLSRSEAGIWRKVAEFDKKRYLLERKSYFKSFETNQSGRIKRYRNRKERIVKKQKKRKVKCDFIKQKQYFSSLFVQYRFLDEDNFVKMQVEKSRDIRCPFCLKECTSDVNLVAHCQMSHIGFSYNIAEDEKKNLFLSVCRDSISPNSDERNRHLQSYSFCRPVKPSGESIHASLLVEKKSRLNNGCNMTASFQQSKLLESTSLVPSRQYYHSSTITRMKSNEWEIDSDDEADDGWIQASGKELLYELEDVSAKEKSFMAHWNKYIKTHTILPDKDMPKKCKDFILSHIHTLIQEGLRQNLLLHLCNLWDEGILSSHHIWENIYIFDVNHAKTNSC